MKNITLTTFNKVLFVLAAAAICLATTFTATAATLTSASLNLGDSRPGQTGVQYSVRATGFTTGQTIGCIEIDLGASADGSGAITGLNTAASTFVSQSITASGTWAVSNAQSANHILRLTNATPVVPQAGSQTAVFGGVTNGTVANTPYYGVIKTYQTTACTTEVDSTTVQFVYTNGQAVTMSVDGSLTFTVAGVAGGQTVNAATTSTGLTTTATTIPLGTATAVANRIAAQDLTVATNAGNGYSVYARYLAEPTSGTNTINDHSGTNAAPTAFSAAGTEAFGYTTNDATLGTAAVDRFTSGGGNKWAAFTTTNAEVAYNNAASASQVTRVGIQAGIDATTPAGNYTTTVIYTATPVY